MQGPHILQDLYSSETYVYWMEVVNFRKITIWHNEDVHSFVLIIVRK